MNTNDLMDFSTWSNSWEYEETYSQKPKIRSKPTQKDIDIQTIKGILESDDSLIEEMKLRYPEKFL